MVISGCCCSKHFGLNCVLHLLLLLLIMQAIYSMGHGCKLWSATIKFMVISGCWCSKHFGFSCVLHNTSFVVAYNASYLQYRSWVQTLVCNHQVHGYFRMLVFKALWVQLCVAYTSFVVAYNASHLRYLVLLVHMEADLPGRFFATFTSMTYIIS